MGLAGRGYLRTRNLGLVDDYSRFVISLRIHTDYQIAPILGWLDDCFELCGPAAAADERQGLAIRRLDPLRPHPLRQASGGAAHPAPAHLN